MLTDETVDKVTVVAFDIFGTVADMSSASWRDREAYDRHLRACRQADCWMPLKLPKDWERLPLFADSIEGIDRLRTKVRCVTLSNAPLDLQASLFDFHKLFWDFLVPVEAFQLFKPDPRVYVQACKVLQTEPSRVLMVTANEDFGDLGGSAKNGMPSQLIRGEEVPTITALAERFGV